MGFGDEGTHKRKFPSLIGSTVLAFLFTLSCVRIVPPAHIAVKVTWGTVSDSTFDSGLHLTNPFAELKLFVTKTQLLEQANHVPTKEGLTVDLDVALLYHIEPNKVRSIFVQLGEAYRDVIIKPELASAVRGLTSEVEAKALYTSGRAVIQQKLKAELTKVMQPRGLVIEDVLLKAVQLPAQLARSIELKAQAEQESERMAYVLSKEKQEAQRKEIEARGIAAFQRIVSEGISPALLQWKAVEATEKLITSPNSKVVLVGNTHNSLPIMLSGDTDSLGSASNITASSSVKSTAKKALNG